MRHSMERNIKDRQPDYGKLFSITVHSFSLNYSYSSYPDSMFPQICNRFAQEINPKSHVQETRWYSTTFIPLFLVTHQYSRLSIRHALIPFVKLQSSVSLKALRAGLGDDCKPCVFRTCCGHGHEIRRQYSEGLRYISGYACDNNNICTSLGI